MLRGGTRTFTDPDQYLANFPEAKIRLVFTTPGPFKARLTWVSLPHLQLVRCTESLPRIAYLSWASARNHLSFPLSTAFNPVWAGIALQRGDIIFHGQVGPAHDRTKASSCWGHISVAPRHLAAFADAVTAGELATPQPTLLLGPSSAARHLLQLHRKACRLAETEPQVLAHPEAVRALEHELLHGIIHCLSSEDKRDNRTVRRAAIMTDFEALLAANPDRQLSIPEICESLSVAERTLRMYCSEALGMSPGRYLRLSRLNRVRAALRSANPTTTSVAEVARCHQFSELGRFAAAYRETFGELPSTTLSSPRVKMT